MIPSSDDDPNNVILADAASRTVESSTFVEADGVFIAPIDVLHYEPPTVEHVVKHSSSTQESSTNDDANSFISKLLHQKVDEFRWFAFNQPLRGDHFGITNFLLDTAKQRFKEYDYFGTNAKRDDWVGGATNEEWLLHIKENPDVGLFTIAYMHDGPRWLAKYYVKLLLYLILCAQLLIPSIFWLYRAQLRELVGGEVCPSTAQIPSRVFSLCVAFIYFTKINLLTMEKLARGGKHEVLKENNQGGVLQVNIALDRHMDLVYKALVYILNLKIVFIEENAIEIILNALAMEFILMLDGEMKELYLRVFEPDIYAYRLANNEFGTTPIRKWQFRAIVLFSYYNWAALWLALVVLFLFLIYMPLCKV